MKIMLLTAGIDIGSNSVKVSIVGYSGDRTKVLAHRLEKIRRRKTTDVIQDVVHGSLKLAGLEMDQLSTPYLIYQTY